MFVILLKHATEFFVLEERMVLDAIEKFVKVRKSS